MLAASVEASAEPAAASRSSRAAARRARENLARSFPKRRFTAAPALVTLEEEPIAGEWGICTLQAYAHNNCQLPPGADLSSAIDGPQSASDPSNAVVESQSLNMQSADPSAAVNDGMGRGSCPSLTRTTGQSGYPTSQHAVLPHPVHSGNGSVPLLLGLIRALFHLPRLTG